MISENRFDDPGEKPHGDPRFDKIVRIMITAIIVFFLAIPFVLSLQVYSERIWREAARFFRAVRPRNAGLDPQIIGTLPTFPYRSQNFCDGRNCAVCKYAFEENEEVWLLSRAGAQPRQPVFESTRVEQVLTASSEPVLTASSEPSTSAIHDNLNSEQRQSASSGEEFNLQNPTAILSSGWKKQMNAEVDEGTSEGRALTPLRMELQRRSDDFWSPVKAHQRCSPNSSQSSSRSPVARFSTDTLIVSLDRESFWVFSLDDDAECDAENNDQ